MQVSFLDLHNNSLTGTLPSWSNHQVSSLASMLQLCTKYLLIFLFDLPILKGHSPLVRQMAASWTWSLKDADCACCFNCSMCCDSHFYYCLCSSSRVGSLWTACFLLLSLGLLTLNRLCSFGGSAVRITSDKSCTCIHSCLVACS